MPSARVPLLFAVLVLSAVLTPATKFGDSALLSARVRHALHATDGGMRARRHSTPLPTIREVPDENADVDGSDTLGLSGRLGGRHSLPHDVDGINLDPRVKQLRRLHSTGDLHPGASERLSAELKRKLPPTPQSMRPLGGSTFKPTLEPIDEIPKCTLPSIAGDETAAAGLPFQVSLKPNPKNAKIRFPSFTCVLVSDVLRGGGSGRNDKWKRDVSNPVASPNAVSKFFKAHPAEKYSRGHLIANSYFGDSDLRDATFKIENMVPQYQDCNGGWWQSFVEHTVKDVVLQPALSSDTDWDMDTSIVVGSAGFDAAKSTADVAVPVWMWTAVCRKKGSGKPTPTHPKGSYFVAASAPWYSDIPHDCGPPWPPQSRPLLLDPAKAPDASLRSIVKWLQANCEGPFYNLKKLETR